MGHCHQSVHCDLRFIGDAIYRDKKSAKNSTRLINDRGRAARPYWNFFPLIFGALHVNNNIIINYKDADAASNIKRGGGGGGGGGGDGGSVLLCNVNLYLKAFVHHLLP